MTDAGGVVALLPHYYQDFPLIFQLGISEENSVNMSRHGNVAQIFLSLTQK